MITLVVSVRKSSSSDCIAESTSGEWSSDIFASFLHSSCFLSHGVVWGRCQLRLSLSRVSSSEVSHVTYHQCLSGLYGSRFRSFLLWMVSSFVVCLSNSLRQITLYPIPISRVVCYSRCRGYLLSRSVRTVVRLAGTRSSLAGAQSSLIMDLTVSVFFDNPFGAASSVMSGL